MALRAPRQGQRHRNRSRWPSKSSTTTPSRLIRASGEKARPPSVATVRMTGGFRANLGDMPLPGRYMQVLYRLSEMHFRNDKHPSARQLGVSGSRNLRIGPNEGPLVHVEESRGFAARRAETPHPKLSPFGRLNLAKCLVPSIGSWGMHRKSAMGQMGNKHVRISLPLAGQRFRPLASDTPLTLPPHTGGAGEDEARHEAACIAAIRLVCRPGNARNAVAVAAIAANTQADRKT